LVNAGQWTVNPQTKITLDRPSHARLTAFPPPLPFLLPSSSKLFVSTFFSISTNSVHAYTRQCLAQSRSSLRLLPSPSQISNRSWLTGPNSLALATRYVFPECHVAFMMRPSSRLDLYVYRACRMLGAIVSCCDRRVSAHLEARRDTKLPGLDTDSNNSSSPHGLPSRTPFTMLLPPTLITPMPGSAAPSTSTPA
jgi:hypothetical protein